MRENKVIYGLIGYGGMGRWHTEILSNVPEIEIGGIYDIKEEKRIEAKEKGFSKSAILALALEDYSRKELEQKK